MRLIFSVDALRPPLTGVGRYAWELASRLQHASELRQLRFFRNNRWVADPARLLETDLPSAATAPAAEAAARPVPPPWVRWSRALYWNNTTRFNVFHSPNYFLPPFARHGVVTVHDLSVLKFPESHPLERVRQFEKSFRQTLAIASQLITDTQAVRQEVIDELGWPAERVTAVPLGVSADYFPRSPDELDRLLIGRGLRVGGYTLCVSTIEPRKRIDALLGAYRLLPPILRNSFPLVLIGGKGWHADALFDQIDTARGEGWLHYLGFVPAHELPLLFAGALLFVYPSAYEGFGLPVVEAMASGVPVVTSNRSCLPEVSGGAAKLVDPDDIGALASSLEAGICDEDWRHRAVAEGLKVAARYSWDECLRGTIDVYRAALR